MSAHCERQPRRQNTFQHKMCFFSNNFGSWREETQRCASSACRGMYLRADDQSGNRGLLSFAFNLCLELPTSDFCCSLDFLRLPTKVSRERETPRIESAFCPSSELSRNKFTSRKEHVVTKKDHVVKVDIFTRHASGNLVTPSLPGAAT